jgi:myosin heavy subunit
VVFIVVATFAAASAAKEIDPAQKEVEGLIAEAAQAEKKEDCETAYAKYREAEARVANIADPARSGQLESIITNKIDKVRDCYEACQPNERQRQMYNSAKDYSAQGQPKRAVQIAKRMLVGKNEKCKFWGGVRAWLRSLPAQLEQEEKYDPCDMTPEQKQALAEAREAVRKQDEEAKKFEVMKAKLASKMPELIALFKDIDGTRMQVSRFREEFLDCDEVYNPLVDDAKVLKESFDKAQELVVTTYRNQVASLSKKVKDFQQKLKERDTMLELQGAELDKLRKEFDDLSAFNEEMFNDLFNLVGVESIKFTTTVEGHKIDQPIQDIQALLADQSKILKAMQDRYPEYFADGVNVEGLKRKKFVMEKLQQMLGKFAKRSQGQTLGYERTMTELDATIKMMNSVIEANKDAGSKMKLKPVYLAIAVVFLAAGVVGLVVVVLMQRKKATY